MSPEVRCLNITPFLLVENVDEAVEWYLEAFGARLQHSLPKQPPYQWASILLEDEAELMFAGKSSAQAWYSEQVVISAAPANLILYVYVRGIDSLFERIDDKALVLLEPVDQAYGYREFAFRDPFGFTIVCAEAIR